MSCVARISLACAHKMCTQTEARMANTSCKAQWLVLDKIVHTTQERRRSTVSPLSCAYVYFTAISANGQFVYRLIATPHFKHAYSRFPFFVLYPVLLVVSGLGLLKASHNQGFQAFISIITWYPLGNNSSSSRCSIAHTPRKRLPTEPINWITGTDGCAQTDEQIYMH